MSYAGPGRKRQKSGHTSGHTSRKTKARAATAASPAPRSRPGAAVRRLSLEQLESLAQVYVRGARVLWPQEFPYEGPTERRGRPSRWNIPRSGYGNRPVLVRLAALAVKLELRAARRAARRRFDAWTRQQRKLYPEQPAGYLLLRAEHAGLWPLPSAAADLGAVAAKLYTWGALRTARRIGSREVAYWNRWIGGLPAVDRVIADAARSLGIF